MMSRLLTSFLCVSDEGTVRPWYMAKTFWNFSSEIFGSLRKSWEMIGNVQMIGAVFVSIFSFSDLFSIGVISFTRKLIS